MNYRRILVYIAIFVIIGVTLIALFNTFMFSTTVDQLSNMNIDIKILETMVNYYYFQTGKLPVKGDKIEFEYSINPNDNEEFYEIDLEVLPNVELKNGKHEKEGDFYIINKQSHTVYYYNGIKVDGKNHYTRELDYEKVGF